MDRAVASQVHKDWQLLRRGCFSTHAHASTEVSSGFGGSSRGATYREVISSSIAKLSSESCVVKGESAKRLFLCCGGSMQGIRRQSSR